MRSSICFAVLFFASLALAQEKPLDSDAALDLAARIADADDPKDRAKALEELKRRGDDGIWELLEAAKEFEDEDIDTLAEAIAALGKDAVPELVRTLAAEDEDVLACAEAALLEIGKDAVPVLLKVTKEGLPDAKEARFHAAALLVKIGVDAIPGLVALVKSGPKDARELAVSSLLRVGAASAEAGSAVCKATQDLLKSKTAEIREAALQTVGVFGKAEAMPAVIDALCSDDEKVRKTGALCAAMIGEPAVPDLVHCLNAADVKVADAASIGLAAVGSECAAAVEKVLRAPIPQVRAHAARALGLMKHRPSFEKLVAMFDDEDAGVRTDVRAALEAIASVRFASRADAQAWWDREKASGEGAKDPDKR